MRDPRRRLLNEMGVVVWERRRGAPATPVAAGEEPRSQVAPLGVHAMRWPELERAVAGCTGCDLHRTRTRTVFGVGSREASLLVIGEAPGQQEDLQGEPFVGRAGQLLNAMLRAIGFAREEVYIANTLKCRPPRNRDPTPSETERCSAFLDRQIALVGPQVILAVGRIAAQTLLATQAPLGRLRGRVHRHPGTGLALVVTYHPAYLLRSPAQKRGAWGDLRLARRILGEAEMGGRGATSGSTEPP